MTGPEMKTFPEEVEDADEKTGLFVLPERRKPVETQAMRTIVRVTSGVAMLRHALLTPTTPVGIGREPTNALLIDDASVSRRHAEVRLAGSGVVLVDLGSTNGTWYNGQRLEGPRALDIGERFEVGKATLRVERLSEAELVHLQRIADRLDVSMQDPLTGLFTRRWADEELLHMVLAHEQRKLPISCLYADIDHFKRINDTYGHAKGDDALRAVAQIIADAIRKTDVGCRWGGEEFVSFLAQCDERGAVETAERIRRRVEDHDWASLGLPPITISLGVAERAPREPVKDWMDRADQGLYQAKHSGRNRVGISPPPT
jgi:diguanylate cyclase (GGDEF)-like protein